MEEKNEDGIKILLNDVEKEFYRLTPQSQVRFAIEQISMATEIQRGKEQYT